MANKLLAKAIMFASAAHLEQFDKSGQPYILHALHVMNTVKSKDPHVKQIAVLHDILEDTPTTGTSLASAGFSARVVTALEILTHKDGEPYEFYIERILTSKDAMLVKMADLKHNSDITRLKGVTEKDLARMAKYHKAYILIKKTLKAL